MHKHNDKKAICMWNDCQMTAVILMTVKGRSKNWDLKLDQRRVFKNHKQHSGFWYENSWDYNSSQHDTALS